MKPENDRLKEYLEVFKGRMSYHQVLDNGQIFICLKKEYAKKMATELMEEIRDKYNNDKEI